MAYIRDLGDRYRVEVKHTYADGEQLRWSRYVPYDNDPRRDRDATAREVAVLAEQDVTADPPVHPGDRYKHDRPVPYDPGMTLGQWLKMWHPTRAHMSKDAHSNQTGMIDNHIIPAIGHIPLSELTRDDVQTWAYGLSCDLMPRSADSTMKILKTAIKAAVVDPRVPISANPIVQIRMERPEPTGREALTVAQVAALARHATYSWPDGEGDYSMVILSLAFTGLRAREFCLRDRHDLTLRRTIEIRGRDLKPEFDDGASGPAARPKTGKRGRTKGKATKSPAGARSVILAASHADDLSSYLAGHDLDALWISRDDTRITYATVRRVVIEAAAAAVKAGNDLPEGVTPHWLRHTHATWLEEAQVPGVAIDAQLGHKTPGMAGVYRHVTEPMRELVRDALEARYLEVRKLMQTPRRATGT